MNKPSQSSIISIPNTVTQSTGQKTADLVNSFLDRCRNNRLSKYTIRWYSGNLVAFVLKFPELPTTPELIEGYIGSYQAGDERVHGVFRSLRAFYNFTYKRNDWKNNPVEKIKAPRVKPKAKNALSISQLNELLTYAGHNEMIKALLYLLADTGIRIGETAGIVGADIGPDSLKVGGKTGQRIVPISPEVKTMLQVITPASTCEQQRLFPHSAEYLAHEVSKAIKASGLQGFSCHSLRHTFCTLWDGTDTALKQITGHRSWQMIERYKHDREAQAAIQHKSHSPVARMAAGMSADIGGLPGSSEGVKPPATGPGSPTAGTTAAANIDTIIKLAQDLGAARERIKQLETDLLLSQVKDGVKP